MHSTWGCTWRRRQQRNKTRNSSTATGWWRWHGCCFIFLSYKFLFQFFKMYSAILQIIILWVVVPNFICWILISPVTVMTVVVHINEAFCPIFIESVSFHIMYEAVGAPTPLCRRSIYNLWKNFFFLILAKVPGRHMFPTMWENQIYLSSIAWKLPNKPVPLKYLPISRPTAAHSSLSGINFSNACKYPLVTSASKWGLVLIPPLGAGWPNQDVE